MPRNVAAYEWPKADRESAKAAGDHKIPAGAYYFMHQLEAETFRETDRRIGVKIGCPCGCGGKIVLWFKGGSLNGGGEDPAHEWDVDGEWPKATMSPSIGYARDTSTGQFHWHGYLRNGVFEEC